MKTLDQVGSLLASLQGNKILQKLSKKKEEGFYKNDIEFRQALKQNLLDVASVADEPLYVPTAIVPGVAYSEVFNSNIEDILLDLEVLFQEINYLFSKIKSHETFFNRSITEGEILFKKLEQNLESIKIESSPDNFFNKVFYNTFVDASNKIDFSSLEAKEFYYDYQIKKRALLENLCPVDVKQSKISLPKFNAVKIPVAEAKILTTESAVSDYEVSFPGNKISNILNEDNQTSWNYSILTKKQLKDPAKLTVELSFGDIVEINSVVVNPNSSDPVFLQEIYVISSTGVKNNFEIESGTLIEAKTFMLPRTLTKSIYFSFKQDKNKVIPYNPKEGITLTQLQRDPNLPLTMETIGDQIVSVVKDPSIKNILGLENKKEASSMLVHYYNFSLNSITVSTNSFKNKGIYVSKFEEFKKLRNLGLYVEDFVPKEKHWQTKIEMWAGSIEYVLFKKDYTSSGKLVNTSAINILPIGTDKINNERLNFQESLSVSLRFIGHKTNGDGSNIKVYRNGELLIRGTDWRFPHRQSPDPSSPLIDLYQSKTVIELLHNSDQIYNGVYWAEYSPRFILDPELVVVDNGIRFLENCSIVTPDVVQGQEIATSDVSVQIIVRNHTEYNSLSPYVDYYRLAGKEE
jgi:hypothetical protein